MSTEPETSLDPVLISVMANRLDGIVREMTNTCCAPHARR